MGPSLEVRVWYRGGRAFADPRRAVGIGLLAVGVGLLVMSAGAHLLVPHLRPHAPGVYQRQTQVIVPSDLSLSYPDPAAWPPYPDPTWPHEPGGSPLGHRPLRPGVRPPGPPGPRWRDAQPPGPRWRDAQPPRPHFGDDPGVAPR